MPDFDVKKFRKALLSWYDRYKRDLPFRHTRDPYKIWLSETMLQQTTMGAVIPYYERFIAKYPDPASVAAAEESELLTLWQGLGYYSRIRNFQLACRQVVAEFGGKLPADFKSLKTLKGVGDYTAAAVASIAFNLPHAVVDGNVKRVLSRLFAFRGEIGEKKSLDFFNKKATELFDSEFPGDFNQAVMELGATVCRPKSPTCLLCPVAPFCAARAGNPEDYPVKKIMSFIEVDFHSLVVTRERKILLKKPDAANLISGMWELPGIYEPRPAPQPDWKLLPELAIAPEKIAKLGSVRHGITNKKITAHVYSHPSARFAGTAYEFVPLAGLSGIPLNTLAKKILTRFPL